MSSQFKKQEGTSPLFVAAFAGYFSIVRYLIEKGANVDVKTSHDPNQMLSGLTPLHGAASSRSGEQVAIIRFLPEFGAQIHRFYLQIDSIWTIMHCGSDAVTCLVEHGMSLTLRCQSENRTFLHYWAREQFPSFKSAINVVQLLEDKGADLQARDYQNPTPLLAAAQPRDGCYPNFQVLDLLSKRDIDWMEKIEALELAGAVIIGNRRSDPEFILCGFTYWRIALHLRGAHHLKLSLVLKTVSYTEWSTELEEIVNHILNSRKSNR